ncbi:MAG: hypothetical protein MK212_01890 [Saprospiraceae bacterium]|nr:hypothetical protein [Saprospiraceae bacterium]
MDKQIQLTLSIEEINLILKALGGLPFNQVFDIIGKIHDQANEQTQTLNANKDATPKK